MKFALSTSLGAVLAAGVAFSAAAYPVCGEHAAIVQQLADGYKEVPASLGITGDGGLLEIYVSESGTWTILVTPPGGPSCLVAAGQDWEEMPEQVAQLQPEI